MREKLVILLIALCPFILFGQPVDGNYCFVVEEDSTCRLSLWSSAADYNDCFEFVEYQFDIKTLRWTYKANGSIELFDDLDNSYDVRPDRVRTLNAEWIPFCCTGDYPYDRDEISYFLSIITAACTGPAPPDPPDSTYWVVENLNHGSYSNNLQVTTAYNNGLLADPDIDHFQFGRFPNLDGSEPNAVLYFSKLEGTLSNKPRFADFYPAIETSIIWSRYQGVRGGGYRSLLVNEGLDFQNNARITYSVAFGNNQFSAGGDLRRSYMHGGDNVLYSDVDYSFIHGYSNRINNSFLSQAEKVFVFGDDNDTEGEYVTNFGVNNDIIDQLGIYPIGTFVSGINNTSNQSFSNEPNIILGSDNDMEGSTNAIIGSFNEMSSLDNSDWNQPYKSNIIGDNNFMRSTGITNYTIGASNRFFGSNLFSALEDLNFVWGFGNDMFNTNGPQDMGKNFLIGFTNELRGEALSPNNITDNYVFGLSNKIRYGRGNIVSGILNDLEYTRLLHVIGSDNQIGQVDPDNSDYKQQGAIIVGFLHGRIRFHNRETILGTGMKRSATLPNSSSWDGFDRLLTVGNGQFGPQGLQSDALSILKNGRMGIDIDDFRNSPLSANAIAHGNGARLTLAGQWLDVSDSTKKHSIDTLAHGMDVVSQLNPKEYKYKFGTKLTEFVNPQKVEELQNLYGDTLVLNYTSDTSIYYDSTYSLIDSQFVLNVDTQIQTVAIVDSSYFTHTPTTFPGVGWWQTNQDSIIAYLKDDANDEFFDLAPSAIKTEIIEVVEEEVLIKVTDDINDFINVREVNSCGLLAQEVKPIMPDLVDGDEGNMVLDYNGIVAILVNTIKELEARIKALETP